MRVFLTGGTGLLGSHLARLLREAGHGVVALARPGADTRLLTGWGCTIFHGDVRDPADALSRGMERCTHLVHGAALVYADGSWPAVKAVNVDGTRRVFEAAARAGVGHATHLSSIAAYGPVEGPVDEADLPGTDHLPADVYGRSKRLSEEEVREVEAGSSLGVTVVRPSAVYGEYDRLMIPAVARILRGPVAFLLGPGDNPLPVVYAGNVATALLAVMEAGRGKTTYNVALDHPISQRDLFGGIAAGMGRSPRMVSVPAGVVRNGAVLLERMRVGTPGAKHLPLTRVVRLALGDNPYPSIRIRVELGWTPAHTHHEALRRSARWWFENKRGAS
ncbi:MAG: NAD-dependent epimerase/dehydratase family protein [Gemmatimonadota bacterium]|nr:NAD-dependent epimerase/dehydratase family protein [Gemmatimonadota bacterium]MDH5760213.1 NAD-dependent epimerase/dehydratase family protein [Gemmatimonadota bacterium]